MNSNNFSIRRTALYIRRHLAVNGSKLIFVLGLVFGAYLAVVLLDVFTSQHHYLSAAIGDKDIQWTGICNIFLAAVMILSCVSGSMFYTAYGSDRNRLQTLTVPVKQIEKFCAYFLIYVVGTFVTVTLFALLTDLLRVAALKMFTPYGEYVHPIPLSYLLTFGGDPLTFENIKYLISWWGFAFLMQSVFVVGSIFAPRHPFLITGCVVWGLSMITGLLGYLGTRVFYGHQPVEMRLFEYDITPQTLALKVFLFLIPIAFLYWLSYYRMKQTEVTNRW